MAGHSGLGEAGISLLKKAFRPFGGAPKDRFAAAQETVAHQHEEQAHIDKESSALRDAALSGQLRGVKLSLKRGAQIDGKDEVGIIIYRYFCLVRSSFSLSLCSMGALRCSSQAKADTWMSSCISSTVART
jgi:hypothetical protein